MRNTLVLSCDHQLIREKASIPFADHTLTMLNDSISPGPPSAAKKNPSSVPSPPGNYWVDQQFHLIRWRCVDGATMESSFTFINQVMVGSTLLLMEEILHQLIGSLSHYLQGFIHPRWCRIFAINSIYAITTVVGSLRYIFWQISPPPGFGNNNENAQPQVLVSLGFLADTRNPPCSTGAVNFTKGWPRLRWSENLLGFWPKEQHDSVLS